MSKTVFEHLQSELQSVVRGRRFIIAEIGKLKVVVEDLKESLDNSAQNEIASTVADLKNYIQNAVNTLGNLKNSVSQLSSTITGLTGTVENTYNIVKGLKASGGISKAPATPSFGAPQPAAPSYSAPQPSAPSYGAPSYSAPQPSAPQPAAPSFGAPSYSAPQPSAPQPAASSYGAPSYSAPQPAGGAGSKFDNILNAAKSGTPAKDLGGMIDQLRTELSKINPLDTKLFELSMEAGRLKSLGARPLDANGIATLEQKVNKWKSQ